MYFIICHLRLKCFDYLKRLRLIYVILIYTLFEYNHVKIKSLQEIGVIINQFSNSTESLELELAFPIEVINDFYINEENRKTSWLFQKGAIIELDFLKPKDPVFNRYLEVSIYHPEAKEYMFMSEMMQAMTPHLFIFTPHDDNFVDLPINTLPYHTLLTEKIAHYYPSRNDLECDVLTFAKYLITGFDTESNISYLKGKMLSIIENTNLMRQFWNDFSE